MVLETKGCQIRCMQCAMGKRDSSGSAAAAAAAAVVDGGKIVEDGKHKKEKKEKKRSREDTPDDGCDDLGDLGAFAEKVIALLRVPVVSASFQRVRCRCVRTRLGARRSSTNVEGEVIQGVERRKRAG